MQLGTFIRGDYVPPSKVTFRFLNPINGSADRRFAFLLAWSKVLEVLVCYVRVAYLPIALPDNKECLGLWIS